MNKKRIYGCAAFLFTVSSTLLGGTYRPDDGLLSFLIVLGFLLGILGILQLAGFIKARIRRFLESILEGLVL